MNFESELRQFLTKLRQFFIELRQFFIEDLKSADFVDTFLRFESELRQFFIGGVVFWGEIGGFWRKNRLFADKELVVFFGKAGGFAE